MNRRSWLMAGAVFAGMVAVALGLNVALSGQPLPSTFYAKHAAYGAGLNLLVYGQFLVQATIELARGPLLLLYPGVLFLLVKGFSRAGRDVWLPLVWVGLLVGAYTLWLPALYQHGRYLVPLMPLLLLYGLNGSRRLVASIPSILLPQVSLALLVLIAAISWVRGMQVFAENVGYINEHQVAMSRWINDNTPPGVAVASHDIGALAYFGQRPLVDMAGLASAELTTTSKDVERVISVLSEKRVSYVLIQPNWYPPLYKGLTNLQGVRLLTEGPETQYGAGYRFQVLRVSKE